VLVDALRSGELHGQLEVAKEAMKRARRGEAALEAEEAELARLQRMLAE